MYCVTQPYFRWSLGLLDFFILIIQFKQTAQTLESFLTAIACFDMRYEELEEHCEGARKKKFTYLQSKQLDDEEGYCICNASKKESNL